MCAEPKLVRGEALTRISGGQSLQEVYDQGLIGQQQYEWLQQHPSGGGADPGQPAASARLATSAR